MKIKNIILPVILLFGFSASAQEGEPVILSVTYQFKHVDDLKKPNKPIEQEMILRLGKTESRYNSWTDELSMKQPIKISNGDSKASSGGGGNFGFVPTLFLKNKGIQDFDLLQYPNQKKLIRVVTLGNFNYYIESSLPIINWKIYEEKKQIGGYACQKAVGVYAGRTYTAWFAPNLPFKNGPWKLSGLPGLILEARDSKDEVLFLFKEINKGDGKENTALRITRVVKVTEKAFNKAADAFEKDPVGVYQSQLPIGTTQKAQIAFQADNGQFVSGAEGIKLYNKYKNDLKQQKSNPLELK